MGLPLFYSTMIELLPNTSGQFIYLTLKEKAKYISSEYYLIEIEGEFTRKKRYFVADIVIDNERYTKIAIDTSTEAPTSGNLLISETGQYWYKVFGQDSATNLDPNNTVGEIERGVLHVLTQQEYYNLPTITLPDNIVYYD